MIREILVDTLAGLIALALLGFVGATVGPMCALLLVAASIIGFLLRPILAARPTFHYRPAPPLSRASSPAVKSPLGFPNHPIVPTRDAHFGP